MDVVQDRRALMTSHPKRRREPPRSLERVHCSRIGFTEWSHENQTLTKFRG